MRFTKSMLMLFVIEMLEGFEATLVFYAVYDSAASAVAASTAVAASAVVGASNAVAESTAALL